jgi:hypothetical protein
MYQARARPTAKTAGAMRESGGDKSGRQVRISCIVVLVLSQLPKEVTFTPITF